MILTVNEVLTYMNLDDNTSETENFITSLINSFQAQIENYINYELESKTQTVEFKQDRDYEKYIFKETPINSITALSYKSSMFNSYKLKDSADYSLIKDNEVYSLYLRGGFIEGYTYELIYNYGYAIAPHDIKQVLLEMVVTAFTESAVGGNLDLGLTARSLNLDKFSQNLVYNTTNMNNKWNKILKRHRRY